MKLIENSTYGNQGQQKSYFLGKKHFINSKSYFQSSKFSDVIFSVFDAKEIMIVVQFFYSVLQINSFDRK